MKLGRVWRPDPEGAATWDLLPFSQGWTSGWKLSLGTLPFLVRAENNVPLAEIYGNFVTWQWPDFKNQGFNTKTFATTLRTPPSSFLEKGFSKNFWRVLGFLKHEPSISLHCCCSVAKSCLILCDPMDCSTLGFCPPLSPRVCWNSCALIQWCYLTVSSSVTPFSCPQSFPGSGSFPVSRFFASGG